VSEKRFSPHRPSIPTIFDCNNLPSVCSRLMPPFEPHCCVFDSLARCGTSTEQISLLGFCLIKALAQLVAPRLTFLLGY
jgi:hypothetical protein